MLSEDELKLLEDFAGTTGIKFTIKGEEQNEQAPNVAINDELEANLILDYTTRNIISTAGEHPKIDQLRMSALPHHEGLDMPRYQTKMASGFDLSAAITDPIHLNSIGASAMIPTGLRFEIPAGFEAQIRPRSGLAAKHGITVTNTPGTIDADYRGEIKVLLTNLTGKRFQVKRGDRIAQMVICPIVQANLVQVDDLDSTERGEGGFGSTGVA